MARDRAAEDRVLGRTSAPRPVLGPPSPPVAGTSPPTDGGVRAAQAAVDVDGGAIQAERNSTEGDLDRAARSTRRTVDELFSAAGTQPQPRGVSVTVDGDRAERLTRDPQGQVIRREVGTRDGDDVTFTRTDYRGGNATRQTYTARGDEFSVSMADWKQAASAEPVEPTDLQLLGRAASGEAGVSLHDLSYARDGDRLETMESSVTSEGHSEVRRTYRTQTDRDGIHDQLHGALEGDDPIQVLETDRSTRRWGEDAVRSEERAWSRGDVRVSRSDDPDDDIPPQWKLEKQDGNTYRAQTFVEGNEDFTTVTDRRATGASVSETVRSRGKDGDDESYDVTSTSDTTYADDGTIAEQAIDRHDPDGTRTQSTYARAVDAAGLITERSRATRTDPAGVETVAERRSESVLEQGREKVTRLETRVQGPAGEATSTFTERGGQQLTVNGVPVPLAEGSAQLEALTEAERDLGAQAATDVLTQVKTVAERGGNLLDLTKAVGVGASVTPGTTQADLLTRRIERNRLRLEQRFGAERVGSTQEALLQGASGVKASVGALGVLASSFGLVADIQDQNWVKAGLDVGGIAVGGATTVAGVKELQALRATPNGALAIDDLGSIAGKFGTVARFGGLALGVGLGGYQIVDGVVKGDGVSIAQGGVGVAGTIGAFAAGGAVGGPAGVLVGVGIGAVTLGVQWGIGQIWGGDPKMARVEI